MTGIWIGSIFAAYLLGSIPFGVIISGFHGVDIRNEGSRNIGATNVGRVLGRRWGLLCFFLDLLKGAVPVAVAGVLTGLYTEEIFAAPLQWWLWLSVGIAALLGHMYSLFLRGGGGKGVATTFGALLAMWPVMTIAVGAAFVVWFIMLILFRMVSLASIVAAICIPIAVLTVLEFMKQPGDPEASTGLPLSPLIVSVLLAALVLWKHRGNIARIRNGTERRIGSGRDTSSQ